MRGFRIAIMNRQNSHAYSHFSTMKKVYSYAVWVFVVFSFLVLSACTKFPPTQTPSDTPAPPTSLPQVLKTPTSIPQTPISTARNNFGDDPFQIPPLGASQSLRLRTPDPNILLKVLNIASELESAAWLKFDYGNFRGDFLTSPEARALYDFVQADLDRFYSGGFPSAGHVLTDRGFQEVVWLPPSVVWQILQAGVVDLLNQTQMKIDSGEAYTLPFFDIQPFPVELDGDASKEWILEANSTEYNVYGWIPVDQDALGVYRWIPNGLSHENQVRAQGLNMEITPDLNGDGLQDMIISFDGRFLGTQFGNVNAYAWHEGRISLLDSIRVIAQTSATNLYEVADHDGDGLLEIRTSLARSANFGCEWEQINLYRWYGSESAYVKIQEDPPDTPICNAAHALSPQSDLTVQDKIALLEVALDTLAVDESLPNAFFSLLKVHLATAYVSLGMGEQSSQVVQDLLEFSGEPFNEIVMASYQEANSSVLGFCYILNEAFYSGSFERTALQPYLDPVALFNAYGTGNVEYASIICPLDWFISNYLVNLDISETVLEPVQYLSNLGFQTIQSSSFNWDLDADMEWVAIIATNHPIVLFLDRRGESWDSTQVVNFRSFLESSQIRIVDLNADGMEEIFLLGELDNSIPVSAFPKCRSSGANAVSEVFVLENSHAVIQPLGDELLCQGQEDLEALSVDQIFNLVVRDEESGLPTLDEGRPFYAYLESLERRVLTGKEFGDSEDIDVLMSNISQENPEASGVLARLLYLKGMSFELENREELAIAQYKKLIQGYVNSPWSWLAFARIEPKQ